MYRGGLFLPCSKMGLTKIKEYNLVICVEVSFEEQGIRQTESIYSCMRAIHSVFPEPFRGASRNRTDVPLSSWRGLSGGGGWIQKIHKETNSSAEGISASQWML